MDAWLERTKHHKYFEKHVNMLEECSWTTTLPFYSHTVCNIMGSVKSSFLFGGKKGEEVVGKFLSCVWHFLSILAISNYFKMLHESSWSPHQALKYTTLPAPASDRCSLWKKCQSFLKDLCLLWEMCLSLFQTPKKN